MTKDIKAIGISLLFLIIGFAAIWFVKAYIKIEDNALFVSVLLVPILIFSIVSGRLKGFKAPGGLEANFIEAAKESITIAAEKIEPSVNDMQVIAKSAVSALDQKKQEINDSKPIVMTMILGKADYYDRSAVLDYIEMLSRFRNFKFIVFLDQNNHFVAYMASWSLEGLLKKTELGNEFINIINGGRVLDLLSFPGVIRKTVSTQSTNAEALQEMTKQNLEALVAVDEAQNLKGVVEREQVLSRMILALTK
jgi:signal-transduction protein with cAMP-binding, CBS, and nucleotidyltransferase domain